MAGRQWLDFNVPGWKMFISWWVIRPPEASKRRPTVCAYSAYFGVKLARPRLPPDGYARMNFMQDAFEARMPRSWLVGGMTIIGGAAALMAALLYAGRRDGFDRIEIILFLMLIVFAVGAFEFPQKRYIFYPHRIEAWWWFRWHIIDLPAQIAILYANHRVLVVSASNNHILLQVTREFVRGGQLASDLHEFYRGHRRVE